MSDAVLIATIGAVGTLIKVILDYKTTTKQSNKVLTQIVVQMKELQDQQDLLQDKQDVLTKIGEGNRKGNRNIIRYRVRREMHTALERGFEFTDHYSEVVELYHTYKELGGNGVVDSLFERYEKLPLKEK